MSASREKKARQELNESGYVDPRKAREAAEKAKDRRSTRIYTAVIVAFVLLGVVPVSYTHLTDLNTSSPRKWNAARRSRAFCGVMSRLE